MVIINKTVFKNSDKDSKFVENILTSAISVHPLQILSPMAESALNFFD